MTTGEKIIANVGDRQYELVEGWGQLPEGWQWGQCAGVACDSQDNVHVFTRTEHPNMVFDKSGKQIKRFEGFTPETELAAAVRQAM